MTDLNRLYRQDGSVAAKDLDSRAFAWINPNDGDQSVLSFERHGDDCAWVVVGNFTPLERTYRLGVPFAGKWEEAVNTDSLHYAGQGIGNLGVCRPSPSRPMGVVIRSKCVCPVCPS